MRISQVETEEESHQWIVFLTYSVVSYVILLRGVEGFLLDLEFLYIHKNYLSDNIFVITLYGKIKGEHQDMSHLVLCVIQK